MAYSGRYKVKNPKKYKGDFTAVIYRSLWEKHVFSWCDSNADIKGWSSEEVVIPYYFAGDKKYHRYFPDIKIIFEDKILLVEIKPDIQTRPPDGPKRTKKYLSEAFTYIKNINKWEAAQEYCKDRGWSFEIWTEKTLQDMGLMHKQVPGKLKKPLKRMKPFRRKKAKK